MMKPDTSSIFHRSIDQATEWWDRTSQWVIPSRASRYYTFTQALRERFDIALERGLGMLTLINVVAVIYSTIQSLCILYTPTRVPVSNYSGGLGDSSMCAYYKYNNPFIYKMVSYHSCGSEIKWMDAKISVGGRSWNPYYWRNRRASRLK